LASLLEKRGKREALCRALLQRLGLVRKSSVEEQGPGSPHMEGSHGIRLRPRMEKLRKKERKKERKIDRQRQRQKERKKGSYVFRLRRELRKKDKKERKKERKDSMSFVC